MKIGIIGGGAVSMQFHIPACIELIGFEQFGVFETSQYQQDVLRSVFPNLQLLNTVEDLYDGVEAVILAAPPHTHLAYLKVLSQRNIPVLCEKPLLRNRKELEELQSEAYFQEQQIVLCHTYRFFPNRSYLKSLLEEGYFGDEIEIVIEEGEPVSWNTVSGYNFRKELVPGGVLFDAGIHSLDFILWNLGEPESFYYEDDALGGLESNVRLRLQFQHGHKASLRLSRTCQLSNTIAVKGSKASLTLPIFEMLEIDGRNVEAKEEYSWNTIAIHQLRDFLKNIEQKQQPKSSFNDGMRLVKLIEDCYEQKRQRTFPEKLPLPGLTF